MPTQLSIDDHLAALARAGEELIAGAGRAGTGARVPTCPDWDVLDLIVHQGEVHRWAIAHLGGDGGHDSEEVEQEGRDAPDPLAWLAAGLDALRHELGTLPDDVSARVFLQDAPPPRQFWARRQAHETTMHAVDALAACLGRYPTTAEAVEAVLVSPALAADGLDELLCGFLPRPGGRLQSTEPGTLLVHTTDTGHAWTLRMTSERITTTPGRDGVPDTTFSGTAQALYLGLWNRGTEFDVGGRTEILREWRSDLAIRRTRTKRKRPAGE